MNYISLNEVMWSVTQNPLVANITTEEAAESALQLLKILKLPLAMVTEVKTLEVIEYKAKLPNSLITLNSVKRNGLPLIYSSNPFHTSNHERKSEPNYYEGCKPADTYILQECNIITSFEDGTIEASFDRLALDEDGFPMIPDNESMINAIKYHIMQNYAEALWYVGKITDKVFQHIQQQRDWYVGQAASSLKLLNIDHAEAMANSINRLIVDTRTHQKSYKGFGDSETLKRHW